MNIIFYFTEPKITFKLNPDAVKVGKNVSVECITDLDPSIVNSISWKTSTAYFGNVLKLAPLSYLHAHQTFYCEIKYNRIRIMQRSFRFNVPVINGILFFNFYMLKMNIKVKTFCILETIRLNATYSIDAANLNLVIKMDVTMPEHDDEFYPDRILFFYFDNSTSSYKFVYKYCTFLFLFRLKHQNK